ncbi:Histone PARylation factor 1 [Chionoecetes opilio]|uniref:Histone PARylation factor 1 n=1 Tax=Chionoecetes opilio TaxID=41210 RepID=A0A8J4XWV2_CHIOP|nr:Histone PARylation factor 1 [Chionoecetes opilio]
MAWDPRLYGPVEVPVNRWNEPFEESVKILCKRTHSEEQDCKEETVKVSKRSKTEDAGHSSPSQEVLDALEEDIDEDILRGDGKDRYQTEDPDVTAQDFIVQDSPEDVKFSVEQKFLLEMPQEFFDFWDCCSNINKEKPEEALVKAGLTLVGPYDVMTGKLKELKERKVSNYVCHWRYYYDPPEFMVCTLLLSLLNCSLSHVQTVIAGDEDEFHIGYYRDDPFHMPVFVASMSSVKQGQLKPLGENIFAGLIPITEDEGRNPFKKVPLQRLYQEIESFANKKNYSLLAVTPDMKKRNKKVVAKTFHGAGIVVPVHNDVGYRELPETYGSLKKMLKKMADSKNEDEQIKNFDDIQEIITNVQFAFDEGDHGMGVEFGICLFTYGGQVFHKPIIHLLGVGYELLGREPYVDILQAHLRNRRRGSQLSIMDVNTHG